MPRVRQVRPYYEHAGITIYNADCRAVLGDLRADVVLTDPPYGLGFRDAAWDSSLVEGWFQMTRASAPLVVVITAPTTLWDYPRPDWVLCWTRPGSTSRTAYGAFNHWSPVLVYGKGTWNPDYKRIPSIQQQVENKGIKHPSPKPQELMRWLILGAVNEGGTVLDPFMGSGTTLRAAKDLGRKAIGIEINEAYCEIAAQRLGQEVLDLGGVA